MTNPNSFVRTVCLLGTYAVSVLAQTPEAILRIETQNVVAYSEDNPDQQRWAASATPVVAASSGNFGKSLWIGDIIAVNGSPAKGTLISQQQKIQIRTTPTGSQGVGDIFCNLVAEIHLEILKADGTQIGSLLLSGIGGTGPALGLPSPAYAGHFVVVGGTGAFLGVRGQASTVSQTVRVASITENPIGRQINSGAGTWSLIVQLKPMGLPGIVTTPTGPAVTHSGDFTLVTASKPATAGEILSVFMTGLGPTTPGVDPGKPFPSSPLARVNSPVDVMVNGKSAEVTAAVGYPGAVDGYQVNFRVPPDTAKGTGTIQVSVAWIAGSSVTIPIQ